MYSSAVIYMGSRINHLGQLYQALRPLIDQMEMLGSICKVKENPLGKKNDQQKEISLIIMFNLKKSLNTTWTLTIEIRVVCLCNLFNTIKVFFFIKFGSNIMIWELSPGLLLLRVLLASDFSPLLVLRYIYKKLRYWKSVSSSFWNSITSAAGFYSLTGIKFCILGG